MLKTIVANIDPEETRMALLEDGELVEVSVERTESSNIVGNIYLGKVKNVLPGMQAVFVDIGRDKNAFLYTGDVIPKTSGASPTANHPLTVGQDIMVQIIKDALGSKGPRATTHLTLPGRYVVLMPTVDYIGISRRIANDAERERLKRLAENVRPPGMGIIVRTVAEGKSEEDLHKDVKYLSDLWATLLSRAKIAHAPLLLYRDVNLVIRIVRDYLTADVDSFVLDDQDAYDRVCDLLKFSSPDLIPKVRVHKGKGDVFSHFGIDDALEQISQRQVWLKCGGYIVIDRTEALTVIDVNTGKFVGNTNLSETVLKTNLEAAAEIARQVRLRDIGGIIIIDFIDMDKEEHKKNVLATLEATLQRDRTKSNVLGLTALGLVEMTRKKARQNIESLLYMDCPCCQARGRIQSPETVCIQICRELRKIAARPRLQGRLVIQTSPRVAGVLEKREDLQKMEQELNRKLISEAVPAMHDEVFSILYQDE